MITLTVTLSQEEEKFLNKIIKSQGTLETIEAALLFCLRKYMKDENANDSTLGWFERKDGGDNDGTARLSEILNNALDLSGGNAPMTVNPYDLLNSYGRRSANLSKHKPLKFGNKRFKK